MASTTDNETTPTYSPNYGIELTNDAISELVHDSLKVRPGTLTLKISPLPAGMSYNNKIYIINCDKGEGAPIESYVLKVNGKHWGPAKVDNEVACLLLLQRFCPQVPVPR